MTRIAIRTLLLCLLVSSSAFAQDSVKSLADRNSKPQIGPASPVENLVLTSGRMRITLVRGAAAPVRAGDEVIGLFFAGSGQFAYTADEPVELPAVKTMLRNMKASAKIDERTNVISGTFAELMWTAPGRVPALSGTAAEAIAEKFEANRADFGENRETVPMNLFVLQKLNAPAAKPVVAEFRGDDEWIYTYDDVQRREESLERTFGFPLADHRERRRFRYLATISSIPLGRTRRDLAPLPFLLTKLDYDVTASDQKDVTIKTRQTFVPTANGLRAIALALDEEEYVDDKAPRHLRVKKIATADGKELDWFHRRGELLVTLPAPTVANKPFDLAFETEGDILYRPQNSSFWRLDSAWYPQPAMAAAVFASKGIVRVKGNWTPFTAGKTLARRSENGYNVVEAQLDTPTSGLFVAAGKYTYEEEKRGNLTIRTASYAGANKPGMKKITDLAFNMIKYYEWFLGPFPVEELNIIEVDDYGWGQAPAGFVFITSEAFQPILGEENQFFSEGINERIAHEIAHQYWGNNVRLAGFEENWISEAFAEYSAALLLKKFQGDAVYNRLVSTWRTNANAMSKYGPVALAGRIYNPSMPGNERFYLWYHKGALLLAALHKQLGDEQFLTFMKSYQKSFKGKPALTKDVEGLLGFMTKQDYTPFFDKYYWGTGMPEK
ncbi:MAG TPA: M1 family aminopeptidase [Thermoanaerobaculia bacterium]